MTIVEDEVTGPQFPPQGLELVDVFSRTEVNPAAGADVSIVVPFGQVWRVIALTAKITASSAVANRFIGFQVDNIDGDACYQYHVTSALTASQSATFTFSEDITTEATVGTTDNLLMPKPSAYIPPGFSFGTFTQNIDTADTWTDVRLWVHAFQPC